MEKYILYKAGDFEWNKLGSYTSKYEMIYDLIHVYGLDELEDCDESVISSILENFEFKFEVI